MMSEITPHKKEVIDLFVESIKKLIESDLNLISTVDPTTDQTQDERFQNQVLRPILKFQHKKLVGYFIYYSNLKKWTMPLPSSKEFRPWIKMRLAKDIQLRYALIGMVLGMFTPEILVIYEHSTTDLSKRIVHMLVERLYDALRQESRLL